MPKEKKPAKSKKRELVDAILTRILLILGVIFVAALVWQVTWKALTPNTLLNFLPDTTIIATEQFAHSTLPIVRNSQKLIGDLDQNKVWLASDYPVPIVNKINQLKPRRLLQSWQQTAGGLKFYLLVETSLTDFKGSNNELVTVNTTTGNWYLRQVKPGLYQFSDTSELIADYPAKNALLASSEFVEGLQNLPDQYFAAGYLNPELITEQLNYPNLNPIIANYIQSTLVSFGQTMFTLTPATEGFNLISYTSPTTKIGQFPVTQSKYTGESLNHLPANPQLLISGEAVINRFLKLYQPELSLSQPLQNRYQEITKGLALPPNSFTFLLNLFEHEMTYAEYNLRNQKARTLLIDNVSEPQFAQIYQHALSINNYLNPKIVNFTLRDGTIGRKLVASNREELPFQRINGENVSFFNLRDAKSRVVRVFLSYIAEQRLVVLSDSPSLLRDNFTSEAESVITSGEYYNNILPVLRSSDELTFLNQTKLLELASLFEQTAFAEELATLFARVESISISKNFFLDGLQTYHLIKLDEK